MKNVLLLDTFREIKHSFSRFLSIFTIITLGCGFFSGLKATMPDMVDTATEYFIENKLMDLKLMSTIGVRSEDVLAVRHVDGVKGAMPGYSKDVYYYYNNQNAVLKVMSYNTEMDRNSTNYLNNPVLLEGRFPKKSGECVVEVKLSSPDTFKIGNKLKLSSAYKNEKITDTFAVDTYEIVGIVTSPLYIGYERDSTDAGNGSVLSYIMVPEEDFVSDYYSELYVSFDGLDDLDPFSDEYKNAVEDRKSAVINAFEQSVNKRYENIKEKAESKIQSSQNSVNLLEQLLKSDTDELVQLKQSLEASLSQAEKQAENAKTSVEKSVVQTKKVQAQEKLKIISNLVSARQTGSSKADDQYKAQLKNAKSEIENAKKNLSSVSEPKFYDFNRFSSSDYSSFKSDSQKVDAVAKVFPVFFILVAALVCLTTMTRMVEEQRTVIGTYKALGYSSFKIISKYLAYASTAAVAGSVLGVIVGLQVFPAIIYNSYKIMYNIPKINTPFRLNYMIWCMIVSVACTCSAVVYASVKELKSQPSQLMRPRPPHSGRRVVLERVGFIWNRLDFLAKVTIRNLLRYKKRFFMTVVGVAGCTALIVTGFGLKHSIKTIADKQFNEIFEYDATVVLNSNQKISEAEQKLADNKSVESSMFFTSFDVSAQQNDVAQVANLIVPEKAEIINDFVNLVDIKGEKIRTIADDSVLITEKLSKLLNITVGDSINIEIKDKPKHSFKVGGVVKNYALHYIYISPELYKKTYGENPNKNLAFIKIDQNADKDSFKESLIADDSFLGVSFKSDSSRGFLNSVDSLDSIVALLIFCAGFLAIIVLYNLSNINITERVREIATIKVLGFYDSETSSYIYRENIISAVIGILIGEVMGKILHYFVVITTEVDVVMFNRSLVWWAYLFGALLTAAFTLLVNVILHFKLKKINMVESLKSVE